MLKNDLKNFKEYYWKHALLNIGLPWGLLTGVLFAIVQDKMVLKYFTQWSTILQILLFILGGFLFAWTLGRSFWKRSKKSEVIR